MKEHSQIQKFISVLLIFILLVYMSGCTSTRIISSFDLPLTNSSKYDCIIHCEKLKFLLENSTISNGILSGKISQTYFDNSYDTGNKIHLYLLSDSVVKIDPKGESLSVPLIQVTKAEVHEIYGVGVSFIFIGLALVVSVTLASLDFSGLLNGK